MTLVLFLIAVHRPNLFNFLILDLLRFLFFLCYILFRISDLPAYKYMFYYDLEFGVIIVIRMIDSCSEMPVSLVLSLGILTSPLATPSWPELTTLKICKRETMIVVGNSCKFSYVSESKYDGFT